MTHPRHVANEVAHRVREEMTRQGLDNVDIATAIGLTVRQLRRRLHSEVEFSVGEIDRVAKALGVHPGRLFPTPEPPEGNPRS